MSSRATGLCGSRRGVAAANEFAGLVFGLTGRKSRASDAEASWQAALEVADDLVAMQSDDNGKYRLVAASLCSHSDWRPKEKLGATMAGAHGPIPQLNDEIGDHIDRLFTRLPAD